MISAAILFILFIRRMRSKIDATIKITSMAASILYENPVLIAFSLVLLAIYAIFTAVWLVLFTHLFLIGYIHGDGSQKEWKLTVGSYLLQAFFICQYLWTAATFNCFQKAVIGGVVCQWYFLRHFPGYVQTNPTWNALKAAAHSMGQLTFGGLVLAIVVGSRAVLRTTRQVKQF
jgi:hypothetical protein